MDLHCDKCLDVVKTDKKGFSVKGVVFGMDLYFKLRCKECSKLFGLIDDDTEWQAYMPAP